MLNTECGETSAPKRIRRKAILIANDRSHFPKTAVEDETKFWETAIRENAAFTNNSSKLNP